MKASPSPTKYAPIVPRIRALLPRLISRERARELIAQASIEEALGLLKDTIYGEVVKSTTPRGIQRDLTRFYMEYLSSLKKLSPKEAYPLIDAFIHEVEAGDLLVLAVYTMTRAGEIPDLVTKNIEWSLPATIAREPEALASFSRFLEYLEGTWAGRYSKLIQSVAASDNPARINWARLAITASEYSLALDSLDSRLGKPMAAKPLCPLLNWMIASFLVQAKKDSLEARIIDELLVDVPPCGFRAREARAAYEREPAPESLAGVMDEIVKYVKIDVSKDLVEALEEARARARNISLNKALSVYSSYPFHAGLIAAGIVALKINIEDLTTILSGIYLGLKPEEYMPYTTLQ